MYFEFMQLILMIPKSFEALLYFAVVIFGITRYRDIPWKDRPQIEKWFIYAMAGWLVYISLDSLLFFLAPLSLETAPVGTYIGYTLAYPSLFFVNILRDIAFTGALVQLWWTFFASLTVWLGEARARKIINNASTLLPLFILSLLIVIYDGILVRVGESGPTVHADFSGLGGISIFLFILFFGLSTVILFLSLRKEQRAYESSQMKTHIKSLILGIFLVSLGNLYWLVLGIVQIHAPLVFEGSNLRIWLTFLGHFIWMMAPIFILFGLRKPIEISPHEDEDYSAIGMKNFRKLVEEEILAMYLIKNDKLIYSNPLVAKTLQYSTEEISQWTVTRFLQQIHPEDQAKMHHLYEGSTPKSDEKKFIEFRFLSKKKDVIWVKQIRYSILDYAEPTYQYIFEVITEKKTLQGMLPICARCKKIRDDKGLYVQIEQYISEHSETEFTHGLCPECMQTLLLEE